VHVVAPDALLEQPPERSALLRQTYDAALDAAAAKGCRSLALPAIGCGIRGFPPEEAAKAAFDAAAAWLTFQDGDRRHGQLSRVDFVVYSDFVAHHWWPCALSSFGTALEHAALLDDALAVDLALGGLVWRYRGGA
jgi:O-acetyl-ADP-ribose deacetylase (regulator of RNase III)